MKVKAIVINTDGKNAIVESTRLSACEGCHKNENGGCSVCSLMGANKKTTSRAKNTVKAEVGDTVEIETETKTVIFYAALVFIFPIIVALALYFVADAMSLSNTATYVCAFLGLVLAFALVWLYSKFVIRNKNDVKIISVISKRDKNDENK